MAYLRSSLPDSRISLYKSQDSAFAIPIPSKPPNTVPIQPAASPIHSQWNFQKSRPREFKQQEEKDEITTRIPSSPQIHSRYHYPNNLLPASNSPSSGPLHPKGHACLPQACQNLYPATCALANGFTANRPESTFLPPVYESIVPVGLVGLTPHVSTPPAQGTAVTT